MEKTIVRNYKNTEINWDCSNCHFEGDGFLEYNEKLTSENIDPVNDLAECPDCKHGNIII